MAEHTLGHTGCRVRSAVSGAPSDRALDDTRMFDDDLRIRARRLIGGDFRQDDLSHFYLGLRDRTGGSKTFRDMGDFVAHRQERNQGELQGIAKDIFTSFSVWASGLNGQMPPLDAMIRCARANIKLATDKQIKDLCHCRRDVAVKRLKRAIQTLQNGQTILDAADEQVWRALRSRWIWRPAFSADVLFDDFATVLHRNAIIERSEIQSIGIARTFIALHAVKVMHGSQVKLDDGRTAALYAGYANDQRVIEVKIDLVYEGLAKPVMAPTCLFLTDLHGADHCARDLPAPKDAADFKAWSMPLDITADLKLDRLR